jgi:hypothetical protein
MVAQNNPKSHLIVQNDQATTLIIVFLDETHHIKLVQHEFKGVCQNLLCIWAKEATGKDGY